MPAQADGQQVSPSPATFRPLRPSTPARLSLNPPPPLHHTHPYLRTPQRRTTHHTRLTRPDPPHAKPHHFRHDRRRARLSTKTVVRVPCSGSSTPPSTQAQPWTRMPPRVFQPEAKTPRKGSRCKPPRPHRPRVEIPRPFRASRSNATEMSRSVRDASSESSSDTARRNASAAPSKSLHWSRPTPA